MAGFKKYNIRDVETEMSIQARLAKYPVPDSAWDEYHIDQEINDRGVALDMELVRQAIQMDGRSRSELTQAMKELTALENPNSVQQMKQWLSDNGMETDTLGKKAVAEMLKTAPPELQTVLTLRQQLAKSSVKSTKQWRLRSVPMVAPEECSSFTVPTAQADGQDASFRCKICPRTTWRIWQKPVGLFAAVTSREWKCSTKMCRILCHSLSALHSSPRVTES